MNIARIPALIAAICLSIYWGYVLIKLVRLARKIGKDPNALPRETVGQIMRILWYPDILALLAALWIFAIVKPGRVQAGLAHTLFAPFWQLGEGVEPHALLWQIIAALASILCILGTIATFICWRKMGRSWRIGIDPGEKLDLVCTGPYRYVRHPIYAIRMVMDVCAVLMAPCGIVLLTAAIDFLLLQIEARREERYMESKHGRIYADYKKSVGRFVPRAFVG